MGSGIGLLGVQSPNNLHSPDQTESIIQAHATLAGNVAITGLHDTWLAVLHDVTVYNKDVSNSIQIQ